MATLSLLDLTLLLGGPTLLGAALLRIAGVRIADDPIGYLGWSYLTGGLASALIGFAWLVARLPIDAIWAASLGAAAVLGVIAMRRRGSRLHDQGPDAERPRQTSTLSRVVFALALAATLVSAAERTVRTNRVVISQGDEAHIWARKAKAIYAGGGFGAEFRAPLTEGTSVHSDYPLLHPLLQVFVFSRAGAIVDVANRLPIQAFAFALILVLGGALWRRASPYAGAALLWLTMLSQAASGSCYYAMADGMIALAFLAALDAAERLRASGAARDRNLLCIALAFLVWSKHEGLMLALVAVAALYVGGRRSGISWDKTWPYLLPVGVALLQAGFNRWHRFENILVSNPEHGGMIERLLTNGPELLYPYLRRLLDHAVLHPPMTQLILLMFAGLLLARPRRHAALLPVFTIAVPAALIGYSLVYLTNTSVRGLTWHVDTSLHRVLFHLLPAAAVAVAAMTSDLLGIPRRAAER